MSTTQLRYDSKHPETWPSFLRRIKNHIASKGAIHDDQKRGILLDALDDATLDRVDRWLEPLSTDNSTYQQIMDVLVGNMATPVNPTAQYIKFTARRQQVGESVLAFHEALAVASATIGIADRVARDALVMHQFIAGLADEALQNRILDLEECTLGKAIDTAAQHESTRRSAAVLRTDTVCRVDAQPPRCFFCASLEHLAKACTKDRSTLKCYKCKDVGHVGEVCKGGRKKKQQQQQRGRKPAGKRDGAKPTHSPDSANLVVDASLAAAARPQSTPGASSAHVFPNHVCCSQGFDSEGLFFTASDGHVPPPDVVAVHIQGKPLEFILDNGAGRSMISKKVYDALPDQPPLRPLPSLLTAWEPSMIIKTHGFCGVQVDYKGRSFTLPVLVARGDGPNLLGRNWFKPLGFAVVEVDSVNTIEDCSSILQMVQNYPAVAAKSLGRYNGPPVRIHVDPTKPPKYHGARPVKLPLVSKMEAQIDAYVDAGLWVPIKRSEWASGLVPVPKRDGTLRLCADYKATVNPAVGADSYKSPTVDAVLDALGGGHFFAEVDLKEAYAQIPVDDKSAHILAVNTIKGLHKNPCIDS